MVSKQKQKRKQIYEIYLANKSWPKPFTLKQFKQVFITKMFSGRTLLRAETNLRTKKSTNKWSCGHSHRPKGINLLKIRFYHIDQILARLAARKSKRIRPKITKTFAKCTGIILQTKQSIPSRHENQKEIINTVIDRFISIFKKN
jgi:hypothetical protein